MKPTRTYVLYVLMTIAPTAGVAQELFHGMAVYQMSMGKASAQTYTTYYRGQDIMTEMPQSKMRTLYLESERCMYNVMGMMGKPMVNRYDVNLSTMEPQELRITGRHDPCIVPRAVPVIEAAASLAIYDFMED